MAYGSSVGAVVLLQAPGESQIALAESRRTGIRSSELAMIHGTQRLAPIGLPYVGHEVLQVRDAVALAVALVVEAAAPIDAIGGHSVSPETAIAAVSLVDKRITACGTLDHRVQPGHIPLPTIAIRLGICSVSGGVAEAPLHGVAKGIVHPGYVHVLAIPQVFHLRRLTRRTGQDPNIRDSTIKVLILKVKEYLIPRIRVLPADGGVSVPMDGLGV